MGLLAGRGLPSYIPSSLFAQALMDRVLRGPPSGPVGPSAERASAGVSPPAPRPVQQQQPDPKQPDPSLNQPPAPVMSVDELRRTAELIENPQVRRALLSAIDMAQGNLDEVRANIENWYNGTMDRVSGWYKRRTQTILFLIGLAVAAALNVDAITIARRLSDDRTLRQAILVQAEQLVAGQSAAGPQPAANAEPAGDGRTARDGRAADETPLESLRRRPYEQLRADLQALGFPIGWYSSGNPLQDWSAFRLAPGPQACGRPPTNPTDPGGTAVVAPCPNYRSLSLAEFVTIGLGWLITALAIMLGAPFWFDVLNKFTVIRSTVKPHEKSLAEGSEDRQGGSAQPR